MHNILYLYFIDILLLVILLYACTRKVRTNNTYVEMPDDYAYQSEIITAERMYNDDDQDYDEL